MTDSPLSTRSRLIRIIADQAGLPPAAILPDASPEALGLDSLALVEVIFAIEESFGISVPFNSNDPGNAVAPGQGGIDVTTIGTLLDAAEALITARAA